MTNINNAKVTLTSTTNKKTYTLHTRKDGSITFSDLPSDTYNITITKNGYYDYIFTEPVTFNRDDYTHLKLQCKLKQKETTNNDTDESSNTLDEVTDKTRDIHVTLQPIQEHVSIDLIGDEYNSTGTTNTNGVVEFPCVPFGTYTIQAVIEGNEYSINCTINANNNNPRNITLETQ